MLDIGWSELLVIAIVLIVVVGPKDLPPMIRAFGKTMAGLRKMAGDFRSQFDEALKEADMDDVRQTISDVRNLNPTNSLRDAMNPLRQLGNDIRADLHNATTPPSSLATSAPIDAPPVRLDEPEMKLEDGPPPAVAVTPTSVAQPSAPVSTAAQAGAPSSPAVSSATPAQASSVAVADVTAAEKPKRTRKGGVPKSVQEIEAETVAAKPKRTAKTVSSKENAIKSRRSAKAVKDGEPTTLNVIAAKKVRKASTKAEANSETSVTQPIRVEASSATKAVKPAKAKKDEA